MYKITYSENAEKIIKEQKLNKIKLNSLILEDIKDGNPSIGNDIISILDFGERKIALIGNKYENKITNRNKITISEISMNPIIVGEKNAGTVS